MVRGFADMGAPHLDDQPVGPELPLQVGAALRLDSVLAMRGGWRVLGDRSELPTTQFEWIVAGMNQIGAKLSAHVAYATDGAALRAILPLLGRSKRGVQYYQYMSPDIAMPIDIAHTDTLAVTRVVQYAIKLGKPIVLRNMIEQSAAVNVIRELGRKHKALVRIEPAEPVSYLGVNTFQLQDRIQSAARVSILATSYGLSGGPNDVIFQYVAPSLDQVMRMFHEAMQLQLSGQNASADKKPEKPRPKVRTELEVFEFLRTHAFNCAERGEIRFSCLRLAGRLLAVQMFQVRKRTAWLLSAVNLDRFRSTTLSTLLMNETMRKLQQETVEKLIVPPGTNLREIGEARQMPCVDITIFPWGARSVIAMLMGVPGRSGARRADKGHASAD